MEKEKDLKWRKLDNTAKLFPVLSNKHRTNMYRVSAVLKEDVDRTILQQALEETLPWFDAFNVRLRKGFFWYYFEDNKRPILVEPETTYPCRYINPQEGNRYLFRVTYYKNRINLEAFHAITDGLGAFSFLKELTYCYLDLKNGRILRENERRTPSSECLQGVEDSYVKNYRALAAKSYSTIKAFQVNGEILPVGAMNIIHGYMDKDDLKKVCIEKKASTTQIIAALLLYSIYQEFWKSSKKQRPLALNLPVNLRNFFGSETSVNFFAVTNIQFTPGKEEASFDEILRSVQKQMEEKITKENMQKIISYNVGYEKKLIRFIPLAIKEIGTKIIYRRSEKAYTMTLSNLGKIEVPPVYAEEIEGFLPIMGVGKSQKLKCTVCTYGQDVVVTISSVFENTDLERAFFRNLRKMGVNIRIRSNGANNEKV